MNKNGQDRLAVEVTQFIFMDFKIWVMRMVQKKGIENGFWNGKASKAVEKQRKLKA